MKIPQRIIQTGKDRTLSPLAKAAAANLKLHHPNWEYLYFDDEDIRRFVGSEFPEYQAIFDGFPRAIQRVDFFRYLAIFRLGGFYFDLDVLLSQSLAPLLAHSCVFPFEELTLCRFLRQHHGMDWEIGNYAFGAVANHPFLGAVIENCVRGQMDPAWARSMLMGIPWLFRSDYEVVNSTGPGLLSRTLAERPELTEEVTVLFPRDVRSPKDWHLFGDYGVHLMDGSWRARGSVLRRRLMWAWELWSRRRLAHESAQRGRTRTLPAACKSSSNDQAHAPRGMNNSRPAELSEL